MTYDDFIARLTLEYPKTVQSLSEQGQDVRTLVIPSLLASAALELPKSLWNEAERLVSLFHGRIRENSERSEILRNQAPVIPKTPNASALMSYDFHVDFSQGEPGHLRLIEINTNASMSLMLDLATPASSSPRLRDRFAEDFADELRAAGRTDGLKGARIAIVDDEPRQQKLFIEFLLYKELFEIHGASCVIADRRDIHMRDGRLWARGLDGSDLGPIDLVYNRSTDFYFEEDLSKALREAMLTGAALFSPNPYDYRMLADKNRLVEWSREKALESLYDLSTDDSDTIRRALLRTREVREFDPEVLWRERKKLVFKPRTAYGGRGVYRGSSISRGAFDGVLESDGLAQDFVPAPTTKLGDVEFKYDLRFFAYRDQLHTACARLYQGQMTNATTPGGGITPILWT